MFVNEHAADVAGRAEREQHRGSDLAHRAAGGLGGALVACEIGGGDRLSGRQHMSGQGLAGRKHQAARGVGALAFGVGDRHPAPVLFGQREHGQVGAGQLQGPAGHVGRRGGGFSLEAPLGVRFLIRSRMLTEEEMAGLGVA